MNFVKNLKYKGVQAKEIPCIPGNGAPTTATEGAAGCLYMDLETGKMYLCTAANNDSYSWREFTGEAGTSVFAVTDTEFAQIEEYRLFHTGDVYIITDGVRRGNVYYADSPESAQLQGNISGSDGKTPVKGVDYHTEVDKQEMVEAVLAALPNGDEVAY